MASIAGGSGDQYADEIPQGSSSAHPLLQTTRFGFDEFARQAVRGGAGNTTADPATRETLDRGASIRTRKAAHLSE